jgi:S1-C subfamily serine protease/thioredoxin-related protein
VPEIAIAKIETSSSTKTGPSSTTTSTASPAQRKKKGPTPLLVGLLIGGSVLAVILIASLAAVIYFSQSGGDPAAVAGNDSTPPVAKASIAGNASTSTAPAGSAGAQNPPAGGSKFPKPGASWNVLMLDLESERERREVQVQIDGDEQSVPQFGPVAYSLEAGEHQLTVTRPGYEPIHYTFHLSENGQETYRPFWQREGAGTVTVVPAGGDRPGRNFDGWEQDFEKAKARAAKEQKDILIAFNGSDWCGWCIRLMEEVYFQPAFRERIEKSFVLVHIDSPQHHEAKRKVQNATRNQQMIERFGISGFPTLVLTDSSGQAYAKGGYIAGGVDPFMLQLAGLKQGRAERDRLLAAVETSTGKARIAAAEKAHTWLRENEFMQQYGPTFSRWFETAKQDDPYNVDGVYEALFEMHWMSRIMTTQRTMLDQLQPILDDLTEFNSELKFVDGDRGGRMNFLAAALLLIHDRTEEAARFVDAGLACKPKDPEILARLQDAQANLQFGDVLGFGTGFVVASGGYILTNNHVITSEDYDDDELRVFVQVAGQKEPAPAKVLAQDEGHDIALLQVADASVAALAPLQISQRKIGRGVQVAVFGYPLSDAVGAGLKLTTGGISGLPDAANNGMLLLDCRVNPGNSGGPLCDRQGHVIGMVTAKTSGHGVESYGMAQPADVLNAFLSKRLRGYKPPDFPPGAALEWDEVDSRVSGSVLMIVVKEK